MEAHGGADGRLARLAQQRSTCAEREALIAKLLVDDRAAFADEQTLGLGWYNEPLRAAEMRAGLAASLGRLETNVAAFEIMRHPVTTAMWRAYAAQTGAKQPAYESPPDEPVRGISPDEAAAFAAHHRWSLPSEAEWHHAATAGAFTPSGLAEYTSDDFAPYPGGDPLDEPGLRCARGRAPRVPACIDARRGVPHDMRFTFAQFRCVRWRA